MGVRLLQTTRQALFKRLRARVEEALLPVQPCYMATLQEVRGQVEAVGPLTVLFLSSPSGGGAWGLPDFEQSQAGVREFQLLRSLTHISSTIHAVWSEQALL